jgi:DNA polymerase-3 subunit gamma/tau
VWPLLERIAAGDPRGTVAAAERLAERSVSFDSALEDIAAILHRVALAQAGTESSGEATDRDRIVELAQKLDSAAVQVLYQIAVLGRRDLPLAPDEFAGFSMTLLRMLSFLKGSSEQLPASNGPSERPVSEASRGAPARTAAAAAPPVAAIAFEGDWPAFVARLNLTGVAGMVARHGELAAFENNHLELVVPEAHRMYADRPYQEKLRAELVPHFGERFRLTVRVGNTKGASLAAARSRETDQKQASAAAAIDADPFVRELVRDLGAEVVPSSIRPPGSDGPSS